MLQKPIWQETNPNLVSSSADFAFVVDDATRCSRSRMASTVSPARRTNFANYTHQ
jgi:hypothetical protein